MAASYELDRIDRRILRELQADGRLSNQALSERVALSPSACLARVRRLEESGVIQGYHARIDPFAVDLGVVLYAEITLRGHSPAELERFEQVIRELPAVVEASHMTGSYDYLLKVVARDVFEWTKIADGLTGAAIGVDRINTYVMMDKPKYFVGYPIKDR